MFHSSGMARPGRGPASPQRPGFGHANFGSEGYCGFEGGRCWTERREAMVKAVQGTWMNADCPNERYFVTGQNVTRTDGQGSRHFTLQWDHQRQQLQWGTQGRLSLTWLGDGHLCWAPSRQHARAWRWRRLGPPQNYSNGPWTPQGHSLSANWADGVSSYGPWHRLGGAHIQKCGRNHPYGGGGRWREDRPSGGRRGHCRHFGGMAAQDRLPCGLLAYEVCDLLFRDITPEDYETLLRLDETVAKPTACPDTVEGLPTTSGKKLCGQECVVCLASFEESDVVTTLPCRHHFHRSCVAKWLSECRNACPLCGSNVISDVSDKKEVVASVP